MTRLPYTVEPDDPNAPPVGMIVLQTDETLEPEFAHYFSDQPYPIYVSRIASAPEVTSDTLSKMEALLSASADLLPKAHPYRVVGYGCTSASSLIGSERIEAMVKQSCDVETVTNPLRAAIAAARDLGISKLALLSPYIEEVNEPLRQAFANAGLSTDVFGTFGEADEARVVRIATTSIVEAATQLGADSAVEAVFLSCTNLRTLDAITLIQQRLSKPVLSSNQCLAWHIRQINTPDRTP